jgi:hypothetical protein
MDREQYISMIAQEIYDAEEQMKYYYYKMMEQPDKEWAMRQAEAIDKEISYRNKYGYFKELEDAIKLLRACELIKGNHPDYSYEEQIDIFKKAIEKGFGFDFLKAHYYSTEDSHKIVTALATNKVANNKEFYDFVKEIKPM